MTDDSRQVELDAFMGFGDPFAIGDPPDEQLVPGHGPGAHFVGDDCPPDGHRSEAIVPVPETEAAVPSRRSRNAAPAVELTPTERLVGLVYTSAHGDMPHIVTRHLYEGGVNDVMCTCKASTFNLPAGCWAMAHARTTIGLPPQGVTNAES